MNRLLFERSTGNIGPNVFAKIQTTQLLRSFQPAPQLRFDGGGPVAADGDGEGSNSIAERKIQAHQIAVNALTLERFDGKVLVSGGSDASIKLWDLEQCGNPADSHVYQPVAQIKGGAGGTNEEAANRASTPGAHRFAITHLSFYPFDSAAFLSTSYDQTLKLWDTESTRLSGSFDLGSIVYTHATSPIASHLLVACGIRHPAVRLVDLRSGAAIQSLVAPGQLGGGAGAVLSVAWSPRHEHVLASGSVDGAVRIWDVRRASGLVALLDKEDGVGLLDAGRSALLGAATGTGPSVSRERGVRESAKAHAGAVNGLTWTDDGAFIVSAGHDRRIRVWDAATGANTLVNFGPTIKNGVSATVRMFVSPVGLTPPGRELLFWPNENEILVFSLHEGDLITRLPATGAVYGGERSWESERPSKNRVTSLVWRGAGGGGGASTGVVMGGSNASGGLYSGHLDRQIRAWLPQVEGLDEDNEDHAAQQLAEERTRKRKALDDAYRSLMGRQITFT